MHISEKQLKEMRKEDHYMGKKQTHTFGFELSSLRGLSGVYVFRNANGDIEYVGTCKDIDDTKENWKSRIQSHHSYSGKKLTDEVTFMDVFIPNQSINNRGLLILEYLLIWYLRPPKNLPDGLGTHWRYFYWSWSEETVKAVARDKFDLIITTSIEEYLRSFRIKRIHREYESDGSFTKYGSVREVGFIDEPCLDDSVCTCFHCIARERHNAIFNDD